MALLLSEFNPFREIERQGCAPRGQTVVVICPVCNPAVLDAHDRGPMQRDRESPRESAIERPRRLRKNCSKRPFSDHVITTHKNRVSLKHGVWIEFPCLLEEFRQTLLVLELQFHSVILEPELLGKTAGRILKMAVSQVSQDVQYQFFPICHWNRNFTHLRSPFFSSSDSSWACSDELIASMKVRRGGRFQKEIKLLSKEPKFVGIDAGLCTGPSAENRGFTHAGLGWAQQSSNCRHGASVKIRQDKPRSILREVLQAAAVCTRRDAVPRSKGRCEVSMTGEPARRGNIDQRHRSAGKQRSSLFQAQFDQITMRRLSSRRSERSQEMSPAIATLA